MAATTPQAWSSLFDDTPPSSFASQLYTEEAIQNDNLTPEQIIEKADSNSSLLVEIVSALNLDHETLLSFGDNDLIQTLHRECQEMADYLSARIWHDSGNETHHKRTGLSWSSPNASSSAASSAYWGQFGKALVEAQIAAFITSSEKIQIAFMRFDETRDYLQAKELQREEEDGIRALHKMRQELLPHPYLDHTDLYVRKNAFSSSSSSSNSAFKFKDAYEDDEDDEQDEDDEANESDHQYLQQMDEDFLYSDGRSSLSRAGIEANRHYFRKSEEPRVWQLDPREDFRVNKMKMKKKVDQVEVDRIYKERLLEKSPMNSLHGLTTPMTITPDMLADDEEEEEEEEEEEAKQEEEKKANVVVDAKASLEPSLQQGGAGTSQAAPAAATEEVQAAIKEDEDEDEDEILEGVERINNRALHPLPVHHHGNDNDMEDDDEDEHLEDEDDAGILSDDSWEEIPSQAVPSRSSSVREVTQRLGQVSVDEDTLSTSSSTSSFLLTTDAASTPNP